MRFFCCGLGGGVRRGWLGREEERGGEGGKRKRKKIYTVGELGNAGVGAGNKSICYLCYDVDETEVFVRGVLF